MLQLSNIVKDYKTGETSVRALAGVSLSFRDSEFVCVLGPSGCGKTTLLNIVGGLDRYTSGDLVINGRSTVEYRDRDWDAYRNHTVGFVFQNYNLITHQTVLSNVELALTLSGVGKAQRKRRALKALEDVGLLDQANKKPNQLSGGQMQRVAIARALVNNPDILLADEPTGALDSATSVQVMELLKSIASDRLVIMVTHNPTLAEKYATRTVNLLDGKVVGDSNPFKPTAAVVPAGKSKHKKPSMSLFTAFSLSMNNLMTKKARTLLTAFAGSIGIIGISLILSLSQGVQNYIDRVQEDTLSSYPITIEAEAADLSSLIGAFTQNSPQEQTEAEHENDAVYANLMLFDLLDSLTSMETDTNDLKAFKAYLESDSCPLCEHASVIQYGYDLDFDIYTQDADDNIVKTDVTELLQSLMTRMYGGDYSSYFASMGNYYSGFEVWDEMLSGDGEIVSDTVRGQYDMVYGEWPTAYDEVVLFLDSNNEVSELVLYALGLSTDEEIISSLESAMAGEQIGAQSRSWSYEDICRHEFKLIIPAEYYQYDEATGSYVDMSTSRSGMDYLFNSSSVGTVLRIVGIARPNADAAASMVNGSIGYTAALSDYVIDFTNNTDIVKAQLADEENDVILGLPFAKPDDPIPTTDEKRTATEDYIETLSDTDAAQFYVSVMSRAPEDYVKDIVDQQLDGVTREDIEGQVLDGYAAEMGVDKQTIQDYIAEMDDETLFSYVREAAEEQVRSAYAQATAQRLARYSATMLAGMLKSTDFTQEQLDYIYDNLLPPSKSDSTYAENLKLLGWVDPASPDTINLYSTTFEDKDAIAADIEAYNSGVGEEQVITYTDYVALLMSSITTIINAISYVLIAFVTISLVVSSIMIGIITYISVLERTKEIGILRSIGASKRDVARVFTAETIIEGLAAGLIGIGFSLLLILPINYIVHTLTGIQTLSAVLPAMAAVVLVCISVVLTLVAGIIPSRFAAKRDPVEALRSE